ncbi:MAG: helix-hairpin-helix domain-containing protein [Anaerolineae bacterium]
MTEQSATTNLGLVLLCSVLGLITGGMVVYFSMNARQPASPIVISTPLPTSTPLPSPTPAPIRVYVSGAVHEPAVCELPRGSIVQDAIEAAGGEALGADLASVNLAMELEDQQHVHVPRQGEADPPPVISGGGSDGEGGRVNINTATAGELETLPGVGEVTAQRIIEYREANGPFETIEEIQDVSGIGVKTFEGLRDVVVVGR